METGAIRFTKVRLRLTYGLWVLAALMVLLGGYGIFQMARLADLTEQLYNHPFTVNTSALRITDQITHMQILIDRVDLVRNMADLQKLTQDLEERHAKVVQDLQKVEERFLGDRQHVVVAKQALAEWMRVREPLAALLKGGDPDKIRAMTAALPDYGPPVARLEQSIGAVADFSARRAERFMREAQQTRDRTILLSLLVGVACVVFSLVLGRAVRAPLQGVVNMLSAAASQMAASINQQERITSQQALAVTETTTTMEELDVSSRQSAEQAVRAASGAQQALDLAHQGIGRVDESLQNIMMAQETSDQIAQRIQTLNEQTGEIRAITDLVTDFANETRMLAVNAAVEAVRAGVHGKGFAVLAVETRKLADESKQSAVRIHELVSEMQRSADSTVRATEEGNRSMDAGMVSAHGTAESFRGVVQAIEGASQGAQQISLNVVQQATAIRQVTEAIQSINSGSREMASGMTQIKTGVQVLNDAAQTLKRMI
ncbi:MAG: methyl-accepting chemotaxis protein [Magnetococcus sp. MYC-9]